MKQRYLQTYLKRDVVNLLLAALHRRNTWEYSSGGTKMKYVDLDGNEEEYGNDNYVTT